MRSAISITLLSDKSSGSSALQREFAHHSGVHHITETPHNEYETLYWLKAAALLGLPLASMRYSNVLPMRSDAARKAIVQLVSGNTAGWTSSPGDEALVFGGWEALCRSCGPVFFEKSPHHVHQRSALSLMLQAIERLPEISFRFIGLVRNPMDTLYSMWSRWRYVPEQRQDEWVRAYRNLLWFQEQVARL